MPLMSDGRIDRQTDGQTWLQKYSTLKNVNKQMLGHEETVEISKCLNEII